MYVLRFLQRDGTGSLGLEGGGKLPLFNSKMGSSIIHQPPGEGPLKMDASPQALDPDYTAWSPLPEVCSWIIYVDLKP